MARQTGLFKIKGTLDNVTFYKSKYGNLAKMKTSIDGKRIASDPAFARTRENGEEFGASAKAGQQFRSAMRTFIQGASDNQLVPRVTQLMSRIKNLDATSSRGKRTVAVGIELQEAKDMLNGFEFNRLALLGSILYAPFSVDTDTGVFTINGLVPVNDVVWPSGATHFSITGGHVFVDFATGFSSRMAFTNVSNLEINNVQTDVVLNPINIAAGSGTSIFLLKIEFFQMVSNIL